MRRRVALTITAVAVVLAATARTPGAGSTSAPARPDGAAITALALGYADRAYPQASGVFEPTAASRAPSGATHVRLRQRVDGLLVDDVELRLAFDTQGRLLHHRGTPVTGAPSVATLSAAQAIQAGTAAAGLPPPQTQLQITAGTERVTQFARGGYVQQPSAKLVLTTDGGQLRAAWKLSLPAGFSNWRELLVDAQSGAVLRDVNLAAGAGPIGYVFHDNPDDGPPVATEFAGTLPGARASWSASGLTEGNNTIAGDDRDGDGEPAPSTIALHTFTDAYEESDGVDELTDLDAAANNVFYWTNVAHDRFYERGFTEEAGNFQLDNFGAGGIGDDPVRALVQFGGGECDFVFPPCVNDARFITQEEGLPAFALFTLFQPPWRYIDSAFASDVVLHEYGHGVSNRLIGVSWVGGQHAFALGEGWSDFFAASITGDPVFAEYFNGDQERGLRTHAIDENPYTYADLCHISPAGCAAHADGGSGRQHCGRCARR